MQVKKAKQGYKLVKSLFGKYEEIPENWQQITFQQIITKGPSSGLFSPEENYGKGNKIVGLSDIFKSDVLQTQEMKRVNLLDEEKSRFLLKSYDLVFSRYSLKFEGVGKCLFIPQIRETILFESNTLRVSLNDEIESRYIAYYFNSSAGRHNIIRILKQVSSTGITGTDLKNLKIILPPKPEQQKIASILSNVDNLIIQYDKVIEQTKHLKSAIIQKTLNKISKNQIKSKFGDFLEIQSGEYFTYREFSVKGIPVLKIDNVMHGKVSWETKTYLPKKYLNSHKHLVLSENDIVLALNRPITHNRLKIAKINKNDSPSILYQRVGRFVFLDPELDKEFFFAFSNTNNFKKLIFRILVGSDQPYVKTTELLRQKIRLPEISEQRKFAKVFLNFNSQIEQLESKKSSLESLKKGLLHKLLTGQLRV